VRAEVRFTRYSLDETKRVNGWMFVGRLVVTLQKSFFGVFQRTCGTQFPNSVPRIGTGDVIPVRVLNCDVGIFRGAVRAASLIGNATNAAMENPCSGSSVSIAITKEQFIHLSRPGFVSKKARPPLTPEMARNHVLLISMTAENLLICDGTAPPRSGRHGATAVPAITNVRWH